MWSHCLLKSHSTKLISNTNICVTWMYLYTQLCSTCMTIFFSLCTTWYYHLLAKQSLTKRKSYRSSDNVKGTLMMYCNGLLCRRADIWPNACYFLASQKNLASHSDKSHVLILQSMLYLIVSNNIVRSRVKSVRGHSRCSATAPKRQNVVRRPCSNDERNKTSLIIGC